VLQTIPSVDPDDRKFRCRRQEGSLAAMRVGMVLPNGQEDWDEATPSYPLIRELAVMSEEAGFDSIWVYDHLLYRFEGKPDMGVHECWTVLSALAEATDRVALGALVMCTGYRNAGVLAKMAAALDHVSGGRLIFGLGAGWHDPEYDAFGFPKDRKVSRFAEATDVICSLIRTGRADFDGRYVTARDALMLPPARPDLPILIAGEGPRMLRLTARYADAWNTAWYGGPDDRLASQREAMLRACEEVGRDPAEIELTVGVTVRYPGVDREGPALTGSPERMAEVLAAYADAGVDHVTAELQPSTPGTFAQFGEALRLFRAG
jgi:probable F420-dependent oxidoreductase